MSANTSRVDMSQGEPAFLDDLVALLTAQPDTFYLTRLWCDRATEEAGYQAWLADHTQPKYTDPADSAHVGDNFPDGCARAGDVTLVRDGRDVWEYTDPAWLALIAAVRAHPRLHSGADFTDAAGRPTPDQDHIEKLHWQRDKTP